MKESTPTAPKKLFIVACHLHICESHSHLVPGMLTSNQQSRHVLLQLTHVEPTPEVALHAAAAEALRKFPGWALLNTAAIEIPAALIATMAPRFEHREDSAKP